MNPVVKLLTDNEPLTMKQIVFQLRNGTRSTQYQVKRLLKKGVIKKKANLLDIRSVFYTINSEYRGDVL